MNATPLRLELRRSRMLVLALAVVTALYAGFITVFYTNVAENAAEFEKLLEVYPKEIMLAFGIEGDFADPGVFLGAYVFNFLWPLVAAIGAISLATRVAADADRNFLELPLSTPVTRGRYLLASIATQVVGIAILAVVMVGAILVADLLIEPDFPTGRVALATLHAVAFGVAIAGPTTAAAVAFLDRGRAAALVAGILIVMYLLNVIAQLAPELEAASTLSAFRYFALKELLDTGRYPLADSLLFGSIGIPGWVLAVWLFRRRDLVA